MLFFHGFPCGVLVVNECAFYSVVIRVETDYRNGDVLSDYGALAQRSLADEQSSSATVGHFQMICTS